MPTVYVNDISQHCRQCQRRPLPITAPIEQLLRHGLTRWAASPGVLVTQGVLLPSGPSQRPVTTSSGVP
jgi:hypothetical protein